MRREAPLDILHLAAHCRNVPVTFTLDLMAANVASQTAGSRRIFFGGGDGAFQILTITQNASDSSIYVSAPWFENIVWLTPVVNEDRSPVLLYSRADGPGKLSLHGSGVAHVKPYDGGEPNGFVVRGNALKARESQQLRVRHLVTMFMSEPTHRPSSPANARSTDYVLRSTELHPYVLVFWAIPHQGTIDIAINGSFEADELQEVPPHAGWGGFSLLTHGVIWFAYRTKHMEKWPRHTQACYLDGYAVPLLVGTAEGEFRLELRQPKYEATAGKLRIGL